MDAPPFAEEEEEPSVCLLQASGECGCNVRGFVQPDADFLQDSGFDMYDARVYLQVDVMLVVST